MTGAINELGTTMNTRRFACRLVALAVAALVVTVLTPPASAQPSGQVPDPISSRDIGQYATRLGLSDGQRRALLDAHAGYRTAYAELREGAIAEYQRSNSEFRSWNATADEVRASAEAREKVMTQIRRVDKAFFDALRPILTEAQTARLDDLLLARERERLVAEFPTIRYTISAATVDLATIVDDLEIDAAQREKLAPILGAYHRELTVAARRVRTEAVEAEVARAAGRTRIQEQQEAMAAAFGSEMGVNGDADADGENAADGEAAAEPDPEKLAQAKEAMAERMEEITLAYRDLFLSSQQRIAKAAMAMSDLNRRVAGELVTLLPHDAGRELRQRYMRSAYRRLPRLPGPALVLIEEALADEALDDDGRAALHERRGAAEAALDALLEQMVDVTDAYLLTGGRMWGGDDDDAQREYDEAMERLGDRWNSTNSEALEAIGASVPAYRERASDAATRAIGDSGKLSMVMVTIMDFPGMGASLSVHGQSIKLPPGTATPSFFGSSDHVGPISSDDLDHYARVLRLTDDERALLDALHDDYRSTYDAVVAPIMSTLSEIRTGLWTVAGKNEVIRPDPSDVDRAHTATRQAAEALRAADERFFDDVDVAIADKARRPRLERLRLARARARSNSDFDADGRGFMLSGGGIRTMGRRMRGGAEADIALDLLVDGLELPDEVGDALEPILVDYVSVAAAAAGTRHEASRRYEAVLERLVAEAAPEEGYMPTPLAADSPYHSARERDGKAAAAAREALEQLNHDTLRALRSSLPPESSEALRRAYRTEVYPMIFSDHTSAEPIIAGAFELDDLSDEQRAQVANIAAEYRQSYDALSDKMVAIEQVQQAHGEPDFKADPEEMRKQMDQMRENRRLAKQLRFDRTDLSQRVTERVRLVLTETQRERLDEARKEAAEKAKR